MLKSARTRPVGPRGASSCVLLTLSLSELSYFWARGVSRRPCTFLALDLGFLCLQDAHVHFPSSLALPAALASVTHSHLLEALVSQNCITFSPLLP